MPTTAKTTYSGQKLEPYLYPETLRTLEVRLAASLTLARGTLLGEVTATPGTFAAYADANGDGTQTAKAILPYDIKTDSAGNITLSTTTNAGGDGGETLLSLGVYVGGYFQTSELVGLDAAAVADLGKLVEGTITTGVLRVS